MPWYALGQPLIIPGNLHPPTVSQRNAQNAFMTAFGQLTKGGHPQKLYGIAGWALAKATQALAKATQKVGNQENKQNGPKTYTASSARAPSAISVISTATSKHQQENDNQQQHSSRPLVAWHRACLRPNHGVAPQLLRGIV